MTAREVADSKRPPAPASPPTGSRVSAALSSRNGSDRLLRTVRTGIV